MFKLMIVDDNPYILQDFCQNTDWEAFDFELIGAYTDGQDLLDAAKKQLPDIVISDIQMPGINGFSLASALYEINSEMIIIFISSYSEFEYAKTALKLHVFDYLIKPLQALQLEEVMTRALAQLQQDRQQKLLKQELKTKLHYYQQSAITNYFTRLLLHSESEEQIRKTLHSMGLTLPKPLELYVVAFRLTPISGKSESSPATELYSIIDIDETASTLIPLVTSGNQGAFVFLYSSSDLPVSDILAKFCIDVQTRSEMNVTIGYSEPSFHFSELAQLYKQAYATLKQLIDTDLSLAAYHDLVIDRDTTMDTAPSATQYSESVTAMREFIHQNYMNPIGADEVAKAAYLSPGYANLCFKNECNISIFGYIVSYRTKIAKQLLAETDTHIIRIAELVGYGSKTSFYLAFKRSTGMSPTEYRQRHAALINPDGEL